MRSSGGGTSLTSIIPSSLTCMRSPLSVLGERYITPHQESHVVVLEGVYLDRTDQGRTPRFLPGEPPTDTDIADVVQKISRRVIRKLRQLGYLEAGLDAAVATG